mmetsp:Transcript_10199/g.23985  ORF Transcript_10199/g.23985 Transcript_10199/m.23985 type:complete len:204 (-) Transcript_10199:138-749(-)
MSGIPTGIVSSSPQKTCDRSHFPPARARRTGRPPSSRRAAAWRGPCRATSPRPTGSTRRGPRPALPGSQRPPCPDSAAWAGAPRARRREAFAAAARMAWAWWRCTGPRTGDLRIPRLAPRARRRGSRARPRHRSPPARRTRLPRAQPPRQRWTRRHPRPCRPGRTTRPTVSAGQSPRRATPSARRRGTSPSRHLRAARRQWAC